MGPGGCSTREGETNAGVQSPLSRLGRKMGNFQLALDPNLPCINTLRSFQHPPPSPGGMFKTKVYCKASILRILLHVFGFLVGPPQIKRGQGILRDQRLIFAF